MRRFASGAVALLLATVTAQATPVGVRNVFLNGIDISTAKSQDLRNVDVRINENGDIFLVAPHYQVNEEDTYTPLSKYVKGLSQPAHMPPQKMAAGRRAEPGPAAPQLNATLPSGNPPPATAPASGSVQAAARLPPPSADGLTAKAGEPLPAAPAGVPPPPLAPAAANLPPPPVLPAPDEAGADESAAAPSAPAAPPTTTPAAR